MADERRDEHVRIALEQMHVPPDPPQFFDELWERVQARERAAARRWRRISLVLALVAAGAISSAGILAAAPTPRNVVDLRAVCQAGPQGGLPVFTVLGIPSGPPPAGAVGPAHPPPGFKVASGVSIEDGLQAQILSFSSLFSGYQLDRRRCGAEKRSISFSHSGLDPVGTFHFGDYVSVGRRCLGFARFAFRVRITTSDQGLPEKAQLVVVTTKTRKPLVYLQWSQQTVTGYAAPKCRNTQG
jgi:hypothetical protein